MREPDECSISYCGFNAPRTFEEIQFELLGLANLIKRAEERISLLEQSSFLANLAVNDKSKTLEDYFTKDGGAHDDKGDSIKK